MRCNKLLYDLIILGDKTCKFYCYNYFNNITSFHKQFNHKNLNFNRFRYF